MLFAAARCSNSGRLGPSRLWPSGAARLNESNSSSLRRLIVGRKQSLNFGEPPVNLPYHEADYRHYDNDAGQCDGKPEQHIHPPMTEYLSSSRTLGKIMSGAWRRLKSHLTADSFVIC